MQVEKQFKTRSTAHTGKRSDQLTKKTQRNKGRKEIEDTVCGTLNTTQHSRWKDDDRPRTALEMLHKNGITLYIHNAG